MPKVLVCRDQNVEVCLCGVEKLSVGEFRPSHFEGGADGVPGQSLPQRDGSPLVEKHPQVAATDRLGNSGDRKAALSVLEYRFDLLAGHTGEPFEKIIDPSSALEILEESLHGNARPLEQPSPSHLARHPFHRGTFAPVQHDPKVRRCVSTIKTCLRRPPPAPGRARRWRPAAERAPRSHASRAGRPFGSGELRVRTLGRSRASGVQRRADRPAPGARGETREARARRGDLGARPASAGRPVLPESERQPGVCALGVLGSPNARHRSRG